MKSFLRITIFLSLIAFLAYFFLFEYKKGESAVENIQNLILSTASTNDESFDEPKPNEESLPRKDLTVSTWIPYWDESRGFEIFENNAKKIESVSPVWFYTNANGTLTQRKTDTVISSFVTKVHAKKGKVIPTITNGSSSELAVITGSRELTDKHIAEIVATVNKFGFDGIDIDYENLDGKTKDSYSAFIEKLGAKLHENNKLLTIAVLPKTDNVIYQFSTSRQAQDWSRIGAAVDEFRIMGYDWSHNSTTEAGPIAPTYWIKEILDYAVTQVPKEKIVLGIPLYGYKWCPGGVTALTYDQVLELKNNSNVTFDESSGENKMVVDNCEAWYHDSRTVNVRKEIALDYEIKGVVFWRLGGEDPEIWK